MWQDCSSAKRGGVSGGGLSLDTIWHVRGDASYSPVRDQPGSRHLVVIRTLGGQGCVRLDSGEEFEVAGGSLLVVENKTIRRYWRVTGTWHFWWFECEVGGPQFFPLRHVVNVPSLAGEPEMLQELFRTLRREEPAQRSLASAGLAYLLHRWMAAMQEQLQASPHQARISQSIDAMYAHTDGSYRVAAMAREAGLSERRFREVFEGATGQTPKQFYDGIRLELGRQFLLASQDKIEVVAERLGFSSPFHFSRSFRSRFGVPPSLVKRGVHH